MVGRCRVGHGRTLLTTTALANGRRAAATIAGSRLSSPQVGGAPVCPARTAPATTVNPPNVPTHSVWDVRVRSRTGARRLVGDRAPASLTAAATRVPTREAAPKPSVRDGALNPEGERRLTELERTVVRRADPSASAAAQSGATNRRRCSGRVLGPGATAIETRTTVTKTIETETTAAETTGTGAIVGRRTATVDIGMAEMGASATMAATQMTEAASTGVAGGATGAAATGEVLPVAPKMVAVAAGCQIGARTAAPGAIKMTAELGVVPTGGRRAGEGKTTPVRPDEAMVDAAMAIVVAVGVRIGLAMTGAGRRNASGPDVAAAPTIAVAAVVTNDH